MYFKKETKDSSEEYMKTYNVMRLGDIAFEGNKSKNYAHGRFVENTIGDGIVSHVFDVFRPIEKYDLYFWKYLINNEEVMGRIMTRCTKASTMMTNLVANDFLKEEILVPALDEQTEIGKYLDHIDNLITLHQRKSFLNFAKKNDWEQRKLEDYIVEYREVTTENNQYPALTSSRKGIFLQSEYFAGNQIASEDNKGYNIVPYGYFTYRHMSDDEIFHFNINDIVENGIVSTLYPVFTTTDELDSRYLQYQLNHGHEFARFAVLQKQGGSRTYMYLSKLKQLSLTIPKSVEEQKNISGFFMELDHLITLHQRKCDELKEFKKYMLQNMFPQKG